MARAYIRVRMTRRGAHKQYPGGRVIAGSWPRQAQESVHTCNAAAGSGRARLAARGGMQAHATWGAHDSLQPGALPGGAAASTALQPAPCPTFHSTCECTTTASNTHTPSSSDRPAASRPNTQGDSPGKWIWSKSPPAWVSRHKNNTSYTNALPRPAVHCTRRARAHAHTSHSTLHCAHARAAMPRCQAHQGRRKPPRSAKCAARHSGHTRVGRNAGWVVYRRSCSRANIIISSCAPARDGGVRTHRRMRAACARAPPGSTPRLPRLPGCCQMLPCPASAEASTRTCRTPGGASRRAGPRHACWRAAARLHRAEH